MLKAAYLDVSKLNINSDDIFRYLSKKRIDKIQRLHSENAKREAAGAELLLSSMIGIIFPNIPLPLKIDIRADGKPFFKDYKDIYFNLSHSDGMAACAVSDKEVGIDIQHIKRFNPEIAKRFFTEDELSFIENSEDKNLSFYYIWTRKEALLKCTGQGLGAVSSTSVFKAEKHGYLFKNHKINDFFLCICQYRTTIPIL